MVYSCKPLKHMRKEIWKDVINKETSYEVSNFGKVRSKDRIQIRKRKVSGAEWRYIIIGKVLIPGIDKDGYSQVSLGRKVCKKIHKLVAEAFIPNPEGKPQINHIDGIKTNNCVENLEWCTQGENNNHALGTGLRKMKRGENNAKVKIKIEQIPEIKALYEKGSNQETISEIYNVSKGTISNVITGKYLKMLKN